MCILENLLFKNFLGRGKTKLKRVTCPHYSQIQLGTMYFISSLSSSSPGRLVGAFNKFLYGASGGSRGGTRGYQHPLIFRLN